MPITEEQRVRYSRHLALPEIGEKGQEKLLSSRVLTIGAGGLGSPLILYLAAAGIGAIGVVDSDTVALSNLQRQILHETGDIGRPKVESATDAVHDLNPGVTVIPIHARLTAENAETIIKDYDVVADGSDNFETRFLVNDTCLKWRKPLVSAAIIGFDAHIAAFRGYEPAQPCYRCVYGEIPPREVLPSCAESGVLGAIAGIAGSWQAGEVIKELLGIGESLAGHMLILNTLRNAARKVKMGKDPACFSCGMK